MQEHTHEPTESADLLAFDDGFETTEVVDEGYEKIPEGKYQVVVDRAELTRSRAGHHMLKWSLKILGPTHQGRLLWKNSMIMEGPSLGFLKRDLMRAGLKLQKVSDLPNRLDELVDIVLQVTVKDRNDGNGDQFQNVFIDKRLNVEGDATGAEAKTEASLSKF